MAEARPALSPEAQGLTRAESTELFFAHQGAADREAVRETMLLLLENLRPERLDEAFHRPSEAYGGTSLFEALKTDPQQAYETVRQSFDWDELV